MSLLTIGCSYRIDLLDIVDLIKARCQCAKFLPCALVVGAILKLLIISNIYINQCRIGLRYIDRCTLLPLTALFRFHSTNTWFTHLHTYTYMTSKRNVRLSTRILCRQRKT